MIFNYGSVYGIGLWTGFKLNSLTLLFLTFAYAGISYGRRFLKSKKVPVDSFFLVMGVYILIWLLFAKTGRSYRAALISYFTERQFGDSLELKYGWPVLLLLFGMGEMLYRKLSQYAVTKAALSAVITVFLVWQACSDTAWELLPATALFFVALDGWIEGYVWLVKKEKGWKMKDFLPLLLGTLLLLAVLPVRTEPVSWERVEQAFSGVRQSLNELFANFAYGDNDGEFAVKVTGFSETDDNFWGPLVDDDMRKMLMVSVYAGSGTQDSYFAGVVKEIYETDNWSLRQEGETEKVYEAQKENSLPIDTAEHLYYLYRSGLKKTEGERFCQNYTYSLQYENLHTRVLFAPANTYRIISKEAGDISYESTGVPAFEEKQGNGSMYQVNALSVNTENDTLVEYLRQMENRDNEACGPGDSSTGEDTLFHECITKMNLSNEQVDWLMGASAQELFEEREREIYDRDLQLPEDFAKELQELAENLTRKADNDYDKVQAIVDHLKRDGGFFYSKMPPVAPEGQPIMEYFLLETKEGYCTYFATAAVLLCRSVGIPARYVEGMTVEYEEKEGDFYPIWGRNAHAWGQVYLRGFGWMDIDAAPGYGRRQGNWNEATNHYEPSETQDMSAAEIQPGTEMAQRKITDRAKCSRMWQVSALIMLAVFSLFLVVLAGQGVSYLSYRRAEKRKQAEILIRLLLGCLKKRGLGMMPNETLRMYRTRLGKMGESGCEYLRVFEWYEGIRYGGKAVREEDIKWVENICQAEKKQARRKRILDIQNIFLRCLT